jgi:hypothetical protein
MKAPGDAGPIALERRKDVEPRAHAREPDVFVRRVFVGRDAAQPQELAHLASPNAQPRAQVMTAPRRHAAKPGDAAASHEVHHDALDEVISGVSENNQMRTCLDSRPVKELVPQLSSGRLDRSFRHRDATPLAHQRNADAHAKCSDLLRDFIGTFAQRVVVMRRHEIAACLV